MREGCEPVGPGRLPGTSHHPAGELPVQKPALLLLALARDNGDPGPSLISRSRSRSSVAPLSSSREDPPSVFTPALQLETVR